MGVNNETLMKVTLNFHSYKTYSHLNLKNDAFALYAKILIAISFFKLPHVPMGGK